MLGGAGFGGGKQRRIVDWEVAVVVLYDSQSGPLNAEEEKTGELTRSYSQGKCLNPGSSTPA